MNLISLTSFFRKIKETSNSSYQLIEIEQVLMAMEKDIIANKLEEEDNRLKELKEQDDNNVFHKLVVITFHIVYHILYHKINVYHMKVFHNFKIYHSFFQQIFLYTFFLLYCFLNYLKLTIFPLRFLIVKTY